MPYVRTAQLTAPPAAPPATPPPQPREPAEPAAPAAPAAPPPLSEDEGVGPGVGSGLASERPSDAVEDLQCLSRLRSVAVRLAGLPGAQGLRRLDLLLRHAVGKPTG